MKLIIADQVSYIYPTHSFDKPLNSVLGETYQAKLADGTMIYAEQTFHKPPISQVLVIGPDNLYEFDAYTAFSAKAGLNSIALTVVGRRHYRFNDGTSVTNTNSGDMFNNIFFGTINHQITGKIEFEDKTNKITAYIQMGSSKKQ